MIYYNVLSSDNNDNSFSLNHLTHPDNSKRSSNVNACTWTVGGQKWFHGLINAR